MLFSPNSLVFSSFRYCVFLASYYTIYNPDLYQSFIVHTYLKNQAGEKPQVANTEIDWGVSLREFDLMLKTWHVGGLCHVLQKRGNENAFINF